MQQLLVFGNSIKNTITSLVQAAATVIQNIWSTVSSWLGEFGIQSALQASNIWNSVTSSISNAINAAKSAIQVFGIVYLRGSAEFGTVSKHCFESLEWNYKHY